MTHKKHRLLLGAHISIAGGLEKAIERGESIDCTVIQIFTKSNRQWHAKPITQAQADLFKKTLKASNLESITAHASYLINIGSPKKDIEQKSIKALEQELHRCNQLDISYLVLHPGSHLTSGELSCLDRIAENINKVFKKNTGKTMLLLETMAGQGSAVGYLFEHIAHILRKVNDKKRIGVCFDTCHAFAAGYDMRTPKTYEALWREFGATIGLNKLKVMHINDSKRDLGTQVDRHEHIGKGKLTTEVFRLLFNDPKFFDIPKILETPKESLKEDAMNMGIIRGLLSKETKKKLDVS